MKNFQNKNPLEREFRKVRGGGDHVSHLLPRTPGAFVGHAVFSTGVPNPSALYKKSINQTNPYALYEYRHID